MRSAERMMFNPRRRCTTPETRTPPKRGLCERCDAYAFLRRLNPSPARPRPRRANDAGSGTAVNDRLSMAMHKAPQVAPGLLAWIDAAANWEKNCRAGHDYELLPPEAAIDPSKDEVSINAAHGAARPIRPGFAGGAGVLRCVGGTADRERTESVDVPIEICTDGQWPMRPLCGHSAVRSNAVIDWFSDARRR